MKIKAILAGVVAAGTLTALTAASFADDDVSEIDTAANVISEDAATDEDEIMLISAYDSSAADLSEALKKLVGDELDELAAELKAEIESVGGVDAAVEAIMEQFNLSLDEMKAEMLAEMEAAGASEEEIAEVTAELDSISSEDVKAVITEIITAVENGADGNGLIDLLMENLTDEDIAELVNLFDALQSGAEADGASSEIVVEDGTYIDVDTGADDGSDNPDTGVEDVAVVFGVISVAAAAVVISRKRT